MLEMGRCWIWFDDGYWFDVGNGSMMEMGLDMLDLDMLDLDMLDLDMLDLVGYGVDDGFGSMMGYGSLLGLDR